MSSEQALGTTPEIGGLPPPISDATLSSLLFGSRAGMTVSRTISIFLQVLADQKIDTMYMAWVCVSGLQKILPSACLLTSNPGW